MLSAIPLGSKDVFLILQGGVCLAFADEVLCWLYGTVKESKFCLHRASLFSSMCFGLLFSIIIKRIEGWLALINSWLQMKIMSYSLSHLFIAWNYSELSLAQISSLSMWSNSQYLEPVFLIVIYHILILPRGNEYIYSATISHQLHVSIFGDLQTFRMYLHTLSWNFHCMPIDINSVLKNKLPVLLLALAWGNLGTSGPKGSLDQSEGFHH